MRLRCISRDMSRTGRHNARRLRGCYRIRCGDLGMESPGRILQLTVRLKNICPNKRVALAAIVTELDCNDIEYRRGLKTMTVPAHTGDSCRDVTVRCIKFILPENPDVPRTEDRGTCRKRRFKARFFAHYIDSDFGCCDVTISLPKKRKLQEKSQQSRKFIGC